MRRLIPVAAFCILCAGASARVIHVNNLDGDDRTDAALAGRIPGAIGPVRTIAKALRLANAGDRIVLAKTSEPYRESVLLMGSRHSAGPVSPFVIEGNGATLDGSTTIPPNRWAYHRDGVFSFQPARIAHQQLFIDGRVAVRRPADRADVRLPGLESLEWCLADGKIFFRPEAGRLPADYQTSCGGLAVGITLYYVEGVVIQNLVIQGFQTDGLKAHDVMRACQFKSLTSRANGRSGVCVSGASRVRLEDCVLAENGASQFRGEDHSHTQIERTRLSDATAPNVELRGGEATIDNKRMSTDHE